MAKEFVVGVDVGGQTTKIGVVNARGDVLSQTVIRSDVFGSDAAAYIQALAEAIKMNISQSGLAEEDIRGIGVGAPNGNYYTGEVAFAPNLAWAANAAVPFSKMLQEAVGLPVSLTNDANAAAVGEMAYGAARGMKNFIMITLGTGVGSGIVIDGKVLYGHDGFAGELGHVTILRDGRQCGCGRKGCLEAYCSATGVARSAREFLLKSDRPSLLREMNPDDITSLDVSIAAGKGDELAKEVFEFTGEMLGAACADFAAFSSPEAFIFFGGLVKAGDLIMDPIKRSYDEKVLPIFRGKAKFLVSGLDGASAAVLGASAIGWEL